MCRRSCSWRRTRPRVCPAAFPLEPLLCQPDSHLGVSPRVVAVLPAKDASKQETPEAPVHGLPQRPVVQVEHRRKHKETREPREPCFSETGDLHEVRKVEVLRGERSDIGLHLVRNRKACLRLHLRLCRRLSRRRILCRHVFEK